MGDITDSELEQANTPVSMARGYVTRRRAASINATNYVLNEHPKAAIRYLRVLAGIYGGQTGCELEAVAADLENAYEEGFITQGNPESHRTDEEER